MSDSEQPEVQVETSSAEDQVEVKGDQEDPPAEESPEVVSDSVEPTEAGEAASEGESKPDEDREPELNEPEPESKPDSEVVAEANTNQVVSETDTKEVSVDQPVSEPDTTQEPSADQTTQEVSVVQPASEPATTQEASADQPASEPQEVSTSEVVPEPEKPDQEEKPADSAAAVIDTETSKPEVEADMPVKSKIAPPRTKVSTADPSEGVDLAIGVSGLEALQPVTVGEIFRDTCQKYPDRPGLKYKLDGNWVSVSFSEYFSNCRNAAKSLIKLGLQKYHGVCILGFNSAEWFYANLGAIFAGGLSAGIYATNGPEACKFIIEDCKANVVVVENQKQLDKILQIRDELPDLKAIVQYKGKLSQEYSNVYDWEQFIELGKDTPDSEIEDLISAQKPEECCLLVYTSGTTGNPKGVMLSHDNLTWTAKAFYQHAGIPVKWELGTPADTISYLPLSHIAGQMADLYMPLYVGATVSFADPDALKGTLRVTLQEVKPTLFFGVPRVWEKMMEAIQAKAATVTGLKKKLGVWAKGKALQGNRNIQNKQPLPWGWTVAGIILKKVKEQLGLQDAKLLLVGAAPMQLEVIEFFMGYDVPILELYGMSENTGPATSNTKNEWRLGSVGKAMAGTQVKIDNPDENGEGEVCMYGRHVFMGYLHNEEKTRETIDSEGWLHSGDIGKIDKEGFLSITGRIKEIIITSGGENVAPVPIENKIKAAVPFLSNVMIIGDKRKYLTCLVTLKCVIDQDTGMPKDEIQPQAIPHLLGVGCEVTQPSEIAKQKMEGVMKKIKEGLDKANETSVSRAQKVQKFALLESDFSMPGGELGPTLKLKRRVVVEKYADTIEALYAESSSL